MIVKPTKTISERFCSFLTSKTLLLALLLCFVVSANAQYGPSDDFDGDTVINSIDLDDDNDGIFDTVENAGSTPIFSGFQPLYPATIPATGLLPGNRVIVPNSITYAGVAYDAVVEITSVGGMAPSGTVIITSGNNLAIKKGNTQNNAFFTYSLKFVPTGTATPTGLITGASIPNVTIVFADVDGSKGSEKQGEVVGYANDVAITQAPVVGSKLGVGGFEFPTGSTHGPGAGLYNYYRPLATTATSGQDNETGSADAHPEYWLTVSYDVFTTGNYVFGFTGVDSITRSEAGPTIFLGNIDFTDIDGDGKDNSFDLDSDGDGCSDSNEAYANATLAAPGYQYGNPAITSTGANPIAGGSGGVALIRLDNDSGFDPLDGKVLAATYTTTTAQYKPAVTETKVDKPVDVTGVTTTASFAVVATGASGSQTYKWQQKLFGSTAWTDVAAGTVGGVTYAISTFDNGLTISGATAALSPLNNSDYRIVMDDLTGFVCGPVISASANLRLANILPVANNDTLTIFEDATSANSVNVVVNTAGGTDTDADGTVNIATVDLDPSTPLVEDKTFTVAGQGTYTVAATGVVTFTPVLNYNGSSSVTYTVKDNLGSTSNQATLTISITAVNDAPVAKNDIVTIQEDIAGGINVVTNVPGLDTDIDGTVNVATVDLDPSTPLVEDKTFTVTGQGTYTVTAAGLVTFTPVLNYNGTATPINYTVKDNSGLVSNTVTLTVTVDAVNDAPVANNDNGATAKDTNVIVQVASNDTDIDGTINVASIDLDPTTPTADVTFTVAGQGTYTANANGTVTFDPLASFAGTTTALNYTIQDNQAGVSNVATIIVIVNADSDGDGVLDTTEVIDGTDPLSACSSVEEHATEVLSVAFLNGDCDGDGLLNKEELGTNPKYPFDSNGNGTADYLEINKYELSNSDDEIEIFNGVSPSSDDDKNSVFTIRNIEKYPNNSLEIYNRWGVIVYEAKGYGIGDKLFRGESQGRSTITASSQLPEDTYFYALKYVNEKGDTKERTGYLYINR